MKKLVSLVVATSLLATLAVVGCSQPAPAAPTAAPAKPAAAPTTAPAAPAPTAAPAKPTAAPPQPTAVPKVAYPEKGKTIEWMVPFSAGGGADIATRTFAALMEKELGVSIAILNKPGAVTQTGMTALVTAKPDGYFLGTTPIPSILVPMLNKDNKASYGLNSFIPIANFGSSDNIFAVKGDSPFKVMKDVIDYAKANPEKVKMGDAGIMSNTHLISLSVARETGVKFANVHFGGGGEVVTAMLGGHIDVGVPSGADLISHVKSGAARVLATAGVAQSTIFPDVKNLRDQGFKSANAYLLGFSAPAGTPKEIVGILAAAAKKVSASPAMKDAAARAAFDAQAMDTAEYTAFISEYAKQVEPLIELAKAEAK